MNNKISLKPILILISLFFICATSAYSSEHAFTAISDIIENPQQYKGKFVTLIGDYSGWRNAPGRPPVTRSDWVLLDNNQNAIYCTGQLPQNYSPHAVSETPRPLIVLGKVEISKYDTPYILVSQINPATPTAETMVSVSGILLDPIGMRNKHVALFGVLAKGFGIKGNRMYLLADPTGAIKLGRLPKLYPTGTILRIKGVVSIDDNGLPLIDQIEITEAQVIFD